MSISQCCDTEAPDVFSNGLFLGHILSDLRVVATRVQIGPRDRLWSILALLYKEGGVRHYRVYTEEKIRRDILNPEVEKQSKSEEKQRPDMQRFE